MLFWLTLSSLFLLQIAIRSTKIDCMLLEEYALVESFLAQS